MTDDLLAKYQPTIGIECHVQLKTKSKLFARVDNDARQAPPNTTVSAICFGLPGVLPYLNQAAVELGVRAGLALNAKINHVSKFDRKHYFYPDLPKGYQITQYDQPLVGEGHVDLTVDGRPVRVGIERAHLEEDAGKLTHPPGAEYSLVDLNRAGTPLLEIVSQPDIKSPAAAKAYARELYLLMKYADVSDVDLYHGHMRFDVNISVAPKNSSELGTRAEVKNLNSFRAVEKAAQYEFERQAKLLAKGQQIVQETRGWHDDKQQTFSQRGKEEAHDYRYFPEPDLPPLELSQAAIEQIAAALPAMPAEIRAKLAAKGIGAAQVEALLDEPASYDLINQFVDQDERYVSAVVAFLLGAVRTYTKSHADYQPLPAAQLAEVIALRQADKISSNGADAVLTELLKSGGQVDEIVDRLGLKQTSDQSQIDEAVDRVLAEHPQAAADVKAGQGKAVGFLVGQVMKASGGRVNPQKVQELIKRRLQ